MQNVTHFMFVGLVYNGISSNSFLEQMYSPTEAIITDATTLTNHHSQSSGNS